MADGFEYLAQRQGQVDHRLLAGHGEDGASVHLAPEERSVHTYICGVSGAGKSRFLQNLLFQDISKGHPVCLIDPMGDLYRATLEFIAAGVEKASDHGFERESLLSRFLFLDGTDDQNPLRLNPLEAQPGESSEQQVDDLMRALERLLGNSLEEQRRLRNVLRAVFMLIAELNRLEPEQRPLLPGLEADSYPLQIHQVPEFLNLPDEQRQVLLNALPPTPRLRFHEQYWRFLSLSTPRERVQLVQSSWNVLQYLLGDDLVLRVFDTQHSTFSPAAILREGKSLICCLPKNENLAGARFLGKFLTTKLQHAAYRRPEEEWQRPYYLYLDEFHQFVDHAFADAMTNLRKFGIRVTNAHQSQSQPPFDSPEGQSLLRTVTANSRVKVLFRLDRPDAERMSAELFPLTQQKKNFTVVDRTEGRSEQQSRSIGQSSGRTTGSGLRSGSSLYTDQNSMRQEQGHSQHSDFSQSSQNTESSSTGRSEAMTEREVYYSFEGERELFINALQRLPDRECVLSTAALEGQMIETPFVPDSFYAYVAANMPANILAAQRQRLARAGYELRLKPILQLPAAPELQVVGMPEVRADGVAELSEAMASTDRVVIAVEPRPTEEEDPFLD